MSVLPVYAPAPAGPLAVSPQRLAELHATAAEFEAVFLGLMLGQAGLGESRETFGGGAGEAAFSSMLAEQHGRALAAQGGIGLAEPIFESLLKQEPGQ